MQPALAQHETVMSIRTLASCCVAAVLVACAPRPASAPAGHALILGPDDMSAWCHSQAPTSCEDFRVAPRELVARVDERLTPLLSARLLGFLAPRVQQSLRQYWAVQRSGRRYVVGNFVCRMPPNIDPAHTPAIVDPAGMCVVRALVPIDQPENADFSYVW